MISQEEYHKIRKKWQGRIYADDWIFPRLKHFVEFGQVLTGKKILDIGCNAGVFGIEASKMAESYIGIEKESFYYEQALITQEHMKQPAKIIMADLTTMPKDLDFNAAMVLFVVYHFYPPEVKIFRDEVLPKCDVVVSQIRNSKRKTIKNKYNFHVPRNYIKFLEACGFRSKMYWDKRRMYATIVSKR